jgi:hypothetical protein
VGPGAVCLGEETVIGAFNRKDILGSGGDNNEEREQKKATTFHNCRRKDEMDGRTIHVSLIFGLAAEVM